MGPLRFGESMRKLPLIALLCTISVVLIDMPAVADYQPAPGEL